MGDMELGSLSLEDYIKENKISGRRQGGGTGGGNRRQRRDGGVQKPKRAWDMDKVSQGRRNSGSGGRFSSAGRLSSGGKAIARLSNVPFNITQQDLTDLFAQYRLSKIALHYDFRGRSLGTAELHGSSGIISKLAHEFKDVEIDGRPLTIQVVGEGGSSLRTSGGGRLNARRTSGAGGGRRTGNGGARRSGGGNRSDGRKKLTAEELDQELEAYMQKGKSE